MFCNVSSCLNCSLRVLRVPDHLSLRCVSLVHYTARSFGNGSKVKGNYLSQPVSLQTNQLPANQQNNISVAIWHVKLLRGNRR